LKESREATEIDGPKKLEELDPMLRIFRKVFVDHVQRALEYTVHDIDDLVFHQALQQH
jgi:hypothetical protein